MNTVFPIAEKQRLKALEQTGILDSPPLPEFDQFTAYAAKKFGVKFALVSIVASHRNIFMASVGLEGSTYSPREVAFCSHTIAQRDILFIPDARKDSRFEANPFVVTEPGIRFFAGAPIVIDGMNIGAFSVFDDVPRASLGKEDRLLLKALAALAANRIEAYSYQHTNDLDLEMRLDRKKELVAAQESEKASFVALLSHELRSPLNAITGFTDLLCKAKDLDSDQSREYLGEVRSAADRMERIVASAIRFASAENGQTSLKEEVFKPEDLALSVKSFKKAKCRAKNLTIDFRADNAPYRLKADYTQTEQILTEFLSNAIRMSPEGGTIGLSIALDGRSLSFIVEDEGPGFENPDIFRLSQPFLTDGSLLNKSSEGLGLGLPLADRLARMHGGQVKLENLPGGGARATVTFPAFRSMEPRPR